MSISQIEEEIAALSPRDLLYLQNAVAAELTRKNVGVAGETDPFFGSLEGVMKFQPGWEQDEPLAIWEANRDTPL